MLVSLLCASGAGAIAYYYPDRAEAASTAPGMAVARQVASSSTVAGTAAALPAYSGTAAAAAVPAATASAALSAAQENPRIPAAGNWTTVQVGRGDSLSKIFTAQSLAPTDWLQIVDLGGDAKQLRHLRVGEKLNLKIEGGQLSELTYPLDELHTLDVHRSADGFVAHTLTAEVEHRQVEAAGTIEDSLFLDGRRAHLSDRLIMQLAGIFDYDIDFAQDLKPGDRFQVIYDELYKNGKKLRDGDILAAEFDNDGHRYRAVRYRNADGDVAYYTPQGESLRKAFIRTPVAFTRISSGFNLHRRHPILNIIRAHEGVDYAAPTGTPVKATGEGHIEFIGRRGGYGNFILIKHWGPYETAYGHLSRFRKGLHVGSKVAQGEVIGYVGMTGLATGPHLHYEFRINGMFKNPVTVALPHAFPLPRNELPRFHAASASLLAELDSNKSDRVAEAGSPASRD
jgi:murein DD-endopeptidase MepM/ murein hydrolase activator NlpD